jgi:hypothetical protein
MCDLKSHKIEIKSSISINSIQHQTFISDGKQFSLMLVTIDESFHNPP